MTQRKPKRWMQLKIDGYGIGWVRRWNTPEEDSRARWRKVPDKSDMVSYDKHTTSTLARRVE